MRERTRVYRQATMSRERDTLTLIVDAIRAAGYRVTTPTDDGRVWYRIVSNVSEERFRFRSDSKESLVRLGVWLRERGIHIDGVTNG